MAGTVEGGWWVAFAALDALLFWFLFVGLSTVGGRGERSGAEIGRASCRERV